MIVQLEKKNIRDLSQEELNAWLDTLGEKPFRKGQVHEWLWQKGARSFDSMTNLSKQLRESLNENFSLNSISKDIQQESNDSTIKIRMKTFDGHFIEGVLIPADDRVTACVSSQIGCSLTCSFCATGKMGRKRNLNFDEIFDQVVLLNEVAVSWSDYFTGLLDKITIPFLGIHGIHVPEWATIDYISAHNGFNDASKKLASGVDIKSLTDAEQTSYLAWLHAPVIAGFHLIADIPAVLIVVIITALIYRGIKETRNASNIMVAIKLTIVIMVIVIGIFYVHAENWSPFLPNGIGGVLSGVSAVFFAYIGFDAISTTAEECKNPERDLPRSIMYSIIICTILYIVIALVLTGMVKYDQLQVGDPLSFVFDKVHLVWISGVIAVSAVVAMASVLLVFQLGQPRIWMSMSRDGLLPKKFATIHPKFKTPSFSTIVTMWVVIIPVLVIPTNIVLDLTSMGTLFAFVLVCGGVLKMQSDPNAPRGKFRTPYVNAKFIMPLLMIIAIILVFAKGQEWKNQMLDFTSLKSIATNLPMWLFVVLCFVISYYSIVKNLSLIPVLGLIFCFYMMAQIQYISWIGFVIWLVIGLGIYFSYGFYNSKLHQRENRPIIS